MANHHHTMTRRLAPAVVIGGLLVGSGCSIATDVELADLVGTWTASEARLADAANLNETLDILALGWAVSLAIEASGTYTLTVEQPGEAPDVRTGSIVVENGKDLVLTRPQGQTGEGEVFLEDGQAAFLFDEFAGLTADIYGTGEPIPVTLLLVMERQ